MIKEVELKKKTKLVLELNDIGLTIKNLTKRANEIKISISKLEKFEAKRKLTVCDHAIQRFRERISNKYSNEQIISKLVTKSLVETYYKCNCEGLKITHPDIPNCICIIRRGIIITVLPISNIFNYDRELKLLGEYMNYFINRLCESKTPLTFIGWKEMNIKRSRNKANGIIKVK